MTFHFKLKTFHFMSKAAMITVYSVLPARSPAYSTNMAGIATRCDMLGRYACHGPQQRWHLSSPHGLRCPAESFLVLRGSLRAFLTAHGTAAAAAEMAL